jgi:ketosteroid isomerase-like protein
MSQEQDVEVGAQSVVAWNNCDLDGFLEAWHPDCEWRPAFPKGTEGTGSVFRGHAGMRRAWDAVRVAWTVYRLDGEEARWVGDDLVVLGDIYAKGAMSGIELEAPWGAVLNFRDGKIVRAWDWLSREKALEAVGLPE